MGKSHLVVLWVLVVSLIFISSSSAETIEFLAKGTQAVISGDGRYVAYTSYSGDRRCEFLLYDVGTGTTTVISDNARGCDYVSIPPELSISADGRYVAYLDNDRTHAHIYDALKGEEYEVDHAQYGLDLTDTIGNVRISGDGNKLAFYTSVHRPAGQGMGNCPTNFAMIDLWKGGISCIDLPHAKADYITLFNLSLSNDARRAVFTLARQLDRNKYIYGTMDVYVYDFAEGQLSALTNGGMSTKSSYHSSISADGNAAAYVFHRYDDSAEIFVQEINGKRDYIDYGSAPQLSGDGRVVVYLSLLPDGSRHGLYIYDRDSGTKKLISSDPWGNYSVSDDGQTVTFISGGDIYFYR